jgi:DNA-binding NtrC family response regulator
MSHRVLIADDDTNARKGLRGLLEAWGYEITEAADGEEAKRKAIELLPEVVIADLRMPRLDGLKLLDVLQAEAPLSSIILLTGHGSVETAVGAMKRGAYDYLTKPVNISRLRMLLEKAVQRGETLREVRVLRRRLQSVWGLGKMVGKSAPMQEIYRLIEMAGPTDASVLITGESGTGKELVARSLHDLSPRSASPFVAVNCSAIPETLQESEIFGHEKGAFTGAADRRMGCFELAHNGTLFLDEIVEMGPAIQARFLRVLQDGTVRRVGGGAEFHVNVRVIAATNKEPAQAIKEGILREDFFYRLNLFHLRIPPLRTRGAEDLSLLVQAFIEEFNEKYGKTVHGIDSGVEKIFWMYAWPGNVRELRNCIERAVIVCEADFIGLRHISPSLIGAGDPNDPEDQVTLAVGTTIEEGEKSLILKTLAAAGNNKTRAAALLGISIKTLHNKLQRYENRWARRVRRGDVPP